MPFGCHEPYVTKSVLLSSNKQRPKILSILQFEGQSHLTENSPVLMPEQSQLSYIALQVIALQQNAIH